MSSARLADLFPIYPSGQGCGFAPAEPGRTPSLLLQIELQPRARAGLDVADFHLLKLPLAVHFLERFRREFLEQFVFEIVSLGLHDAAALVVNPRHHARITICKRARIRALQNTAAAAALYFLFQQLL